MAIQGGTEIYRKISSQIESQFPDYIREEGPNFVAFLKAYYEYMEQSGKAVEATRSLYDLEDIDRTVDSFVEYFRREFMKEIPASVLADKRLLTKHIIQFYKTRGSEESYRFLFRILFNKEIDIFYPGDLILRASDGRWLKDYALRVSAPLNINPRSLEGLTITGVDSGATAYVESVSATTASGVEVFDLVLRNIVGNFADAERVINSEGKYVTVNAFVGGTNTIDVLDGGAFHNQNDIVRISGAGSTTDAVGVVTEVTATAITATLGNGGSGYTRENARLEITGGNGTGFAAKIASFASEPILTALNTDLISPYASIPLNVNSETAFRGFAGANSAAMSATLAVSNVNSTLTDALNFSNASFYSINAIAITNPGYGYTTLPKIRIYDDNISLLNVDDGYGSYLGNNAFVLTSFAPGAIKTINISNPGANFNRYSNAIIYNSSQGNAQYIRSYTGASANGTANTKYTIRKTTFSGRGRANPRGVTEYEGRYVDTKGFLSWDHKLQDNYYYQEFSYVIRVTEELRKYRDIVKRLVHPSGTIQFGEVDSRSEVESIIQTVAGNYNILSGSQSESITATETANAVAIFTSFANDTITSTDTVDAYRTFNMTSGTESVTSTEAAQGQRYVLMSGYYQVQFANSEIQALQTAQIEPYAAITVETFDDTARLVTNTTSGAFFSNGAINANTGSISVGGPGSNLYIIPVGDSIDPNAIYQVNTIFSNTALTLRTEYIPVTANARIYYSTGP